MAKGIFPRSGSSSTKKPQVQQSGDEAWQKQESQDAGYGGKGGKLRLPRISLFKRKPYDRPPLPLGIPDRHLSSVPGDGTSSLPARIVDSASNFLTSSASYLFESFFKRRQHLWIGDNSMATAGRGSTGAQQNKGSRPLTNNSCFEKHVEHSFASAEASLKEASIKKLSNEDMGFIEVEEFLKRQSLSREEVKRLTEALQSRAHEGSGANSNLELHRRPEMTERIGEQSNPVVLAKAFMGKRITQQQQQSMPPQFSKDAGSFLGNESIHGRSLTDALRGHASRGHSASGASVRMLKRHLIADDEDDVIPTGPARRVRQKMTPLTNTSPYLRQVNTASGHLGTSTTAVLQTSGKTPRSAELSEEPASPFKGKSPEELPIVSAPSFIEDVPESSNARDGPSTTEDLLESSKARDGPSHTEDLREASRAEISVSVTKEEPSALPTSTNLNQLSCKIPEPVVTIESVALANPGSGLIPASNSELHVTSPVKSRGFRINAFFEDSSSDEETDLPVKPLALVETELPRPLIVKEKEDAISLKHPSAILNDWPCSSAGDCAQIAVQSLPQPIGATGPSNAKTDSGPEVSSAPQSSQSAYAVSGSNTSTFTYSNLKPSPVVSLVPPLTDKDKETSVAKESTKIPSFVSTPVSLSSPPLGRPTPVLSVSTNEASPADMKAEAATSSAFTLPSADVSVKVATLPNREPVESGATEASGLLSASTPQPDAVSAGNVVPNMAVSAAFPNLFAAAATAATTTASAVSVPSLGVGTVFTATAAAMPVANEGKIETQPAIAAAANSSLGASAIKPSSTFESPIADNRHGDLDTMATDPMSEEPDSSTVNPSAMAFPFGSSSSAVSVPAGGTTAFGSQAAPSPFSFPVQSSTPSGVSLSVQSPFNSQSSSVSGQPFTFGNSGPIPANPFSASSQSMLSFGSSGATSMSSMFTATSSAPLSFPATTTPAPSSFLFGAQASSSANSTSGFGSQTLPSASAFPIAGVQNNAPAFAFQASPVTPTPPSFQFGGATAGTSSMSSNPSFGAQTYSFGGQPTSTALNPFSQSGGSNAGSFQFGATAAMSSQPASSTGASAASNFSFGAQPAPSSSPFTFGGQPAASPTGQPFGFGSQPAPPQNPFNLPGATGQSPTGAAGMEFAGGFSLGAAGGEKAGRKFIKAKRIGGPKRGK